MSFWNSYINDLKELEKLGATIFCIGYSVLGRPIFCVRVGEGGKRILVQYAIHAREHITYHLSILQIKHLLKNKPNGEIFFIPLQNPDGVCLSVDGLKSLDVNHIKNNYFMPFCLPQKPKSQIYIKNLKQKLLRANNNSKDFSLWKANINCVDLNVNFNAFWGKGKRNIKYPSSENYIGKHPESEPETKALCWFTKIIKPDMTISYHCKGEVIFWKFFQNKQNKKRDKKIAKEIGKITTYKLKNAKKSCGGFKDWCIQKLKIPSLTIEVGKESLKHPITKKHLLFIFSQNKNVIQKSLALLSEIKV